ncbi:38K [Neodiprion abietis nucleopolyhedrovirus]|uniref:38K n=1 Tax=Neodiprion abietis nucleopolyhedrovirus TaxID=204507 RepID=Q0ZP21_9CBAC|nr:38K [Neodiprion abietis nucleopolyhedrovirus]ABC74933.1 38K [Neodiprion abietis nucleopolyhedrovirus]
MDSWLCLINVNAKEKENVLYMTTFTPLNNTYSFDVSNYIKYIVVKILADTKIKIFVNRLAQIWSLDNVIYEKFMTKDDMREIRKYMRKAFELQNCGPAFVLDDDNSIAHVQSLSEWCKYKISDVSSIQEIGLYSPVKHVIVFDLDNTLITDSIPAELRCHTVIDSLHKLAENHILVLWSYGNAEHVEKSLKEINLPTSLFTSIICGGRSANFENNNQQKRSFLVESIVKDMSNLPKSVTVVTQYLNSECLYYFKSFTLVDDKKSNQINYDFFIQCKKAKKPIHDWCVYHDIIVTNLNAYDMSIEV